MYFPLSLLIEHFIHQLTSILSDLIGTLLTGQTSNFGSFIIAMFEQLFE